MAAFTKDELRVVAGTSGVYALRMVGLYMALPLMSTWAAGLPGATPLLVGLSLGAYGLTQAIFQVPAGILGDLRGRRIVVILSLLVFALGSAMVAGAGSIMHVILGRLVQGVGAMASTLIALIGDSTRDQVRTRAMALMGVVLGVSFGAGFLVGPLVSHQWGVPAVFALSAVLSVIGVLAFEFAVPSRLLPHVVKRGQRARPGAPGSWSWAEARSQLTEPSLLVLDGGIFVLHAGLTALFLVLPFMLRDLVTDLDLWKVYTPALLAGMVSMITASHFADRRDIARRLLVIGPAMCVTGMACIAVFQGRIVPLVVALTLYVAGFAMTEPVLASLLTRYTGRGARGTAAGVFNMVQFSGAFLGGTLGGWLLHFGRIWPVLAMAALAAGWMLSVRRLADPDGLANSEIVPPALDEPAWVRVHRALIAHAGVLEADWQPGGPVRVRHWPRRVTPEELVALVGQAALASAEDRR